LVKRIVSAIISLKRTVAAEGNVDMYYRYRFGLIVEYAMVV
jgi:hypothetical protein